MWTCCCCPIWIGPLQDNKAFFYSVPSCINSSGWCWCGIGMEDVFFVVPKPQPIEYSCCPFITPVDRPSDGYVQQNDTPCHKPHIISNRFLKQEEELTFLHWPPQTSDLNPVEHFGLWLNWMAASWLSRSQI